MLLAVLSKTLRKIRSVVSNYDGRLEDESTSRPGTLRQTVVITEDRTEEPRSSFYAPSNQNKIPDPWDDPVV